MIERLCALDDAIVDRIQDAYLWLWDRTGIYLGTCAILLIALGPAIAPHNPVQIALLAVQTVPLIALRTLQQRGCLTVLNTQAEWFRSWSLRRMLLLFCLILLIGSLDLRSMCAYALNLIAAFYALAVQVRDRQPKDLFAAWRAPALAGGAA